MDNWEREELGLPPSLREAVSSLYSRRIEAAGHVDMRIARAIGGVLWLSGGILTALLLVLVPPTQAIGGVGWLIAAPAPLGCVLLAWRRLHSAAEPSSTEFFVGSLVALVGITVLQWLAGGETAPYHYLYALPVLYAAAAQPRLRAVIMFGLLAVLAWMPLIYGSATARKAADIATELLLLIVLGIVARILFAMLRIQRAGLHRARREADELARRDPLTGLGNRRALEEALEVEVARAQREPHPLSLIIGDVDDFKAVNDTQGHGRGDECLREIAAALVSASRTADQCFRLGGDEFVIVLPNTLPEEVDEVRARVCDAASRACVIDENRALRLTCGDATWTPTMTAADLLAEADQVLFEFKHRSRRRGSSNAVSG